MKPETGMFVLYVDEDGQSRNALITAVHGEGETPSINLVVVSKDSNQTDTYGRKIERETSQPHRVNQSAKGRYWIFP